jgi:hypothetical protein
VIEEADRNSDGCFFGEQATFWEDIPAQSRRQSGEQVLSGRFSGRQTNGGRVRHRRPTCTLYETCNTPLCRLDGSSLNGIWYPDEEICRSRVHGNLSWMKAQRKLSRVAASGYFTVEMLNRLVVIRKGITGLDPNLPEEPQLRTWFQKRAEKQDAPSEAKVARTRHLKEYRFQKQGVQEG